MSTLLVASGGGVGPLVVVVDESGPLVEAVRVERIVMPKTAQGGGWLNEVNHALNSHLMFEAPSCPCPQSLDMGKPWVASISAKAFFNASEVVSLTCLRPINLSTTISFF